jgi:hypothetical protein
MKIPCSVNKRFLYVYILQLSPVFLYILIDYIKISAFKNMYYKQYNIF